MNEHSSLMGNKYRKWPAMFMRKYKSLHLFGQKSVNEGPFSLPKYKFAIFVSPALKKLFSLVGHERARNMAFFKMFFRTIKRFLLLMSNGIDA